MTICPGAASAILLPPMLGHAPLAPRSLRLRRDQIHAAVTALVESGIKPSAIRSLADLVSPDNFKSILRRRLDSVGGEENTFNHNLGKALVQIAHEWVKVDACSLRRTQASRQQNAGAAHGLNRQEQALAAAVR